MRRPFPPLWSSARSDEIEAVELARRDVEFAFVGEPGARTFRLGDGRGAECSFSESAGSPCVVSSSVSFDAIFALAVSEAREASVAHIQNDAFREGAPLPAPPGGWFETGEQWNYVWTRDTAYAVELGLAWFDPLRSLNSLNFKLSELRTSLGGGGLAIVADTGSGGSYPISSDRVAWALGAARLLPFLEGERRAEFARRAEEALDNTLTRDRRVVFDETSGLYRGEQSFLDWREQSYPRWTAEDTVKIGQSAALSTNVAHLVALRLAARLARELGKVERAERRQAEADALEGRVHERFFLPEWGSYGAYFLDAADEQPELSLDLLGTSLAIEFGVTPAEERLRVVATYPRLRHGPPVTWPAQPDVPIYHNRALWPFVTAYHLRAARRAGHTARASAAFMSLFNGAARHRSHLENAEMTSGAARFEDGDLSGPVVNSRRQLWSVAGYLSAVVDVLFGLEADEQGLGFRPWVPVALAKGLGLGSLVCLERLVLRGRGLAVALHMEAPSPTGAWVLGRASLDGVPLGSSFTVPWSRLRDGSRLELWLEPDGRLDAAECYVPVEADAGAQLEALFAPRPVELCRVGAAEGGVLLEFTVASSEKALVEVEVLRDGALVASALPAEPGRYLDRTSALAPHRYSVRAYFVSSGHRSMPSREHLFPGHKTEVRCPIVDGESTTLRVGPLRVAEAGRYALSLLYANGNGGFTTGITCALRHAQLFEADGTSERLLSRGVLQLPHTGSWERRLESSALSAELLPSAVYWLDLDAPAESQNMSFYEHFADYTAGQGGTAGPSNRAQLFELVARPVPALGQPGT